MNDEMEKFIRNDFINVLMERDGKDIQQANEIFYNIIDSLQTGEYEFDYLPDILETDFGLEHDYVMDFVHFYSISLDNL